MSKLTWQDVLGTEKQKDYFQQIMHFVATERGAGKQIYPSSSNVFNAFRLTAFDQIKVVILGQDPYHGVGQANGLAFSVNYGVKIPPSLVNIYKELHTDIEGFTLPTHGCLESWAKQGVLLLNTVLTVEEGRAHSHATQGWEVFTDKVISMINNELTGVVFLLWGAHAQKKAQYVDRNRHYILTSVHPSPLSAYRGFLGCQHFSKTNRYLCDKGKEPIDWQPQPMS